MKRQVFEEKAERLRTEAGNSGLLSFSALGRPVLSPLQLRRRWLEMWSAPRALLGHREAKLR